MMDDHVQYVSPSDVKLCTTMTLSDMTYRPISYSHVLMKVNGELLDILC
jgi:hypothetical protein